jgi:HTH-type transcriptional regulator / antitoxin HigA
MAASLRYEPDYAVAPGRTLRSALEQLGLTQADVAARTGLSVKHVNQVVQGVAPITPETALLLERVTNVPAKYWNLLEAGYREKLARRANRKRLAEDTGWLKELPIMELVRRKILDADDDKPTQVEKACRFFGVADPHRWRKVWLAPIVSFRQSPALTADAGAVATWLRLGEFEAAEISTAPFDAKRFREALRTIRALTIREPSVALRRLKEECARAGVAVVFLPDIGRTRTSGAARWLTPSKAMILLSDRYKADDSFWFSFFHEAAHILLHSKKELFVSEADNGDNVSQREEDEANAFAANQLIPRHFTRRLRDLRTDADVVRFAREIGIAPGIVVGRLHNDEIWGWNRGNRLRQKIDFEDLWTC